MWNVHIWYGKVLVYTMPVGRRGCELHTHVTREVSSILHSLVDWGETRNTLSYVKIHIGYTLRYYYMMTQFLMEIAVDTCQLVTT